jgi:type IV pilus assembly protein PilQ
MVYPREMRKEIIISLWITFLFLCLMVSCARSPIRKKGLGDAAEKPVRIEAIQVITEPSDRKTLIEITSSKHISYIAFKRSQPLRFVVDVNALPAQELKEPDSIDSRLIKDIHFEKSKDRPQSTRIIATLSQDVECNIREKDKTVTFSLHPKKSPVSTSAKDEQREAKPRIFFSPSKTELNQILGVDFSMLSNGKSRVTVTTSKKAEYDISRKDPLTLLLAIKVVSIPSELTRYLNTAPFKGAVNRITPIIDAAKGRVNLEIKLKEMVPYHVMQADQEIRLDFHKTSLKPPTKKITRSKLEKPLLKPVKVSQKDDHSPTIPTPNVTDTRKQPKKYTGSKVTLEFAKADIRNILKLIGEVSNRNIIWGSEVEGTASMRLKNVPWDQALDILLETNDLGMREDGNIIWVTTKEKIKALEKEEEEKRRAELKKIQEKKALEPLITEKIPIKFKDASEIKDAITLSERGTVKVFGNSLIITDIRSSIENVKEQIKEIDTPPIQVMIEARIVDATEDFSRDLGVQWKSLDGTQEGVTRLWQKRLGMGWESDPTQFGNYRDQSFIGSFSSNAPTGWVPNIGLRFATITNRGLGTLALDASLALGESEGTAKIISAPKVMAANTKEATISRGDEVWKEIVTADTVSIEKLPAELSLKVTPTVKPNNYVSMDTEVKDEQVYVDQSGKTTKTIKTKLIVKSGDTVVIGGIYKEEDIGGESGIPGLRNIPLLGWLFKARTKTQSRSELLIFLTPTVLSDSYTSPQ